MTAALAVRERPILFSGAMVRAILDDHKTQTRRVMKPQPTHRIVEGLGGITIGMDPADDGAVWYDADGIRPGREVRCPYGGVGDRLWVRESWQYADWTEDGQPFVRYAADGALRFCEGAGEGETLVDTWATLSEHSNFSIDGKAADRRWRPSIHIPRWASRITLELTGVRVERVQNISRTDAKAEGFLPSRGSGLEFWNGRMYGNAELAYRACWDDLNAKRGFGWDVNPWVWALSFRRLPEKSHDASPHA